MNRFVIAAVLLSGSAVVLAQTPAAKAPAAKSPARKAAPKAPAKPAPKPAELVLPEPDTDQAAAATLVNYGDYACEFSQSVEVTPSQKHAGYVEVGFGKLRYIMKPVLSGTGALRLEDVRGQTMMLQIAFKSMLMDVQAGRRLVDDCVHEKQAAAKKAYEGTPNTGLLSGTPAGTVPQPAAAVAAKPAASASAAAAASPAAAPAAAAASAPVATGGSTAAGMSSGAAVAPAPSSSGGTL